MSDEPGALHVVSAAEMPETHLGSAGSQRVLLGGPHDDGSPLLMGLTHIQPARTSRLIRHDSAEIGFIHTGTGWMVTDSDERPVGPGDAVLIPAGCWHAIRAGAAALQMIYVFPGPQAPDTDAHDRE